MEFAVNEARLFPKDHAIAGGKSTHEMLRTLKDKIPTQMTKTEHCSAAFSYIVGTKAQRGRAFRRIVHIAISRSNETGSLTSISISGCYQNQHTRIFTGLGS